MKFYLVAAGVSRVTSCEDKEKWLFCAVMFPPTDIYIRKTTIIVAQTFHSLALCVCVGGCEQGWAGGCATENAGFAYKGTIVMNAGSFQFSPPNFWGKGRFP